jgi:hypothetical protein
MVKRKITKSKKFAALSSDKARLLWFYMLPFTDVEGRIEADCEDIQDEILRKQRKGYSLQRIEGCLQDLHRVGLITLYSVNGARYLEYGRFADEQNLRRDKEAESEIPSPSQGVVQAKGGSGTALPTLSKDKLSKVKISKYSDSFKIFWKDFKGRWNPDKTRFDKGGKLEASKEWEKLTKQQQAKAVKAAPLTGSKITKDACRWLKYHRWEDFEKEPIKPKAEPPKKQAPAKIISYEEKKKLREKLPHCVRKQLEAKDANSSADKI